MHWYKRSGASEESFDNGASSWRALHNATRIIPILKDVTLLILAIVAIVAAISIRQESARDSCDCGSSTATARALGCEYDTLAAAWLPQHCIDKELTREFDRAGDRANGTWGYFADSKFNHELTIDEVAALADVPDALIYMTPRWHAVHCLFYWRKQVRRQFTGVTIEPRFNTEGHAKHCWKVFEHPEIKTKSGVGLNSDL
ncbi:hypothetical protein F4777DRAFT_596571 [Nemania sp. FL0916]|nr:hypothetical protein F4777DRAFT_596571 [Nemania sp. FL0916]